MKKKCLFVAFSNQKGGVGKSVFATSFASYLHYRKNKNVIVVDCDYPQHSIMAMRERDIGMVNSNDHYKEMLVKQYDRIRKKAYPILSSPTLHAIETAENFIANNEGEYDIVIFDLPGTINSSGVLSTLINVNHVFCPAIPDKIVMHSSLAFVATMSHIIKENPTYRLKSIHLFWNMLIKRENRELYDMYSKIISEMNIPVLQTEIHHTVKFKKEMSVSGNAVFRSTLFPPDDELIKATKFETLMDEICQIINIQ